MITLRSKDLARLILALAVLPMAAALLGPYQQLEHALVPWDKAGHFLAFYVGTALIYVAVPNRRRLDLSVMMAFVGVASEMAQAAVGRDCELGDMVADFAGAFALYAPVYLDRLRHPPKVERRAKRQRRAVSARPRGVQTA